MKSFSIEVIHLVDSFLKSFSGDADVACTPRNSFLMFSPLPFEVAMKESATRHLLPTCLAILAMLVAGVAMPASAQDAEPLGDDFIFFFDGPNVILPRVDGSVVADPLDQGGDNRVHRTQYANWVASGFFFERNVGVDMSANVSENPHEGDTLYVSILVDPANAGKPGLSLTMFDKTDDSAATDGSADLEFRLQWPIPEDLRNGEWHDLEIPLPPTTTAALDSAKAGVDVNGDPLAMPLDENAANWSYGGAWSVGGFGLWAPGECHADGACFQEFQWDGVHGLSVFMDTDQGGGPVYLDNVYIGGPSTDVSQATEVPSAMSGATFTADAGENVVSWTHDPEFGGYNVYANEGAINAAAIENNEAALIGSLAFDADAFEVRHSFEVPHPSLAPMPLYYAVTSRSLFGVENTDVSASSMEIANPDLPIQSYILMATEDEGNMIFDNVAGAVLSDDGFPDIPAFLVDSSHNKAGDAPLPTDDSDMSASVKVTIDPLGFMSVYADVTDDVIGFAGEAVPGTDTWNYDAIEFGIGLYDVRDVGGSILGGSPHIDFQRGAEADFQLRFAPRVNEAGEIVNVSVHSSSDPAQAGGNVNGEIQGGGGLAEITDTGWRILVTFPLDSIIDSESGDVPFTVPGDADLVLIPMNIAFNDADDTGTRESQMIWSTKANAGAGWWNTPSQWPSVAVAGRALATDVEDVDTELPFDFALEQNYPNPFNPSTTIEFSLAKVENVRLSVYNVLGQRVATLLSGESMQAGPHTVTFDASNLTSGMYFYRIDAGSTYSKTRTMMLLK